MVTLLDEDSPESVEQEYDWRDDALCRNTDPGLFFPVGTTGVALESIAHAKAVCDQCTVTQECLDYALDTHQDSGVWGGLSEEERRVIRRQRAAEKRADKVAARTRREAANAASN